MNDSQYIKPTRAELLEALAASEEQLRRKAQTSYSAFVNYTRDDYDMQWFHKLMCKKLDAFERGEIKNLMMFLPPQHGKSELSTRRFPPYLLGRNPKRDVAVVSYNSDLAEGFNRSIQQVMDNESYLRVFPETLLNNSKLHSKRDATKPRTLSEIGILGHPGSIRTVGRDGAITGKPIGIGIIDDPLKDREEAMSPTIREKLYNWYVDVFSTRLDNYSQQLIVLTRWDVNDLAGRLLKVEPEKWEVIIIPAIRTRDENSFDPREFGEALWEKKHSKERILSIKNKNPGTFNSLYQQTPKPNEDILVYSDWVSIAEFPKIQEVSWGLDFGKTVGTNALVKATVTAETTKSWVKKNGILVEVERNNCYLKEYLYARGIPTKDIAELLWKSGYVAGQIVWCDHIPSKINELRLLGITAIPAIKGPGSIRAGIDKMNEYQVYYIGDNIRMETENYQYITYDDVITSEPVDAFNHILDASRYAVLSKFFRE